MEWAGRVPFAALVCSVGIASAAAVVALAGGAADVAAPPTHRSAAPVLVPAEVALREVEAAERAVDRALAPPPVRLTDAERAAALRVTGAFVATAVVRERLAASYDLVTDAYRQGLSRADWARGDIPVQWLPAGTKIAAHRFQSSDGPIVWLLVRLITPPASGLGAHVFNVSLAREPGDAPRFRVDSFAPALRSGGPVGGEQF